MTKKTEPMLAEYVDLEAMAAAAAEERPGESGPPSLLEEFLGDMPAPVKWTGRATPAQVQAERLRLDVADRLGVTIDPEVA